MPPRCAVPSPTAALRPVQSSQDGIWITDAMLVRAIERYQRVSTTSCRHLSSLPGPLESRRRLGKRHMTAIMPGSHASPAPWSIENPWQIGEWKWEAPTAPDNRTRKTKQPGMPRILDRFIGWLEDFDEEATLEQASPAAQSASGTRLQEAVIALRQQIVDMGSVDRTKPIIKLCHELEKDLEAVIRLNMATSQDLLLAFNLFDSNLRTQLHNDAYWDRVSASIGKTIINTIANSQSPSRDDAYGAGFWFAFIEKVCTMTPQREIFNLFASCIDALPQAHFDLLKHEDFFNMARHFVTHQAARTKARPAAILEFSKAFKRLESKHVKCLAEDLIAFLQGSPEGKAESQFYVAALIAHNRHISSSEFLSILKEIRRDGCWDMEEKFAFLRGRMWALKCIGSKQIAPLLRQTADSQGWTSLVVNVCQAPELVKPRALRELCYLSSQLGCFETLALALSSEIPHQSGVFRALAIASEDYRLALKLWEALNSSRRVAIKVGQWDWTAWSSYLEYMIKDPGVDPGIVWKVIALDQTSQNKGHPDRIVGDIRSKTHLLEMMSKWYLEATHLNDRQALRRIQNCVNHYGRISPTLSSVAISNLVQVIVRDLERGCSGRTTRLDYLVSLIYKHLGKAEAEVVLNQIRGWRWSIQNQRGNGNNVVSRGEVMEPELGKHMDESLESKVRNENPEFRCHFDTSQDDAFTQIKELRRESA